VKLSHDSSPFLGSTGDEDNQDLLPPAPPLTAAKVLVATGSRAFRPPGIPFGDPRILDSDLINGLGFLPKSIAITGSGIIAVEYAKIFQRLGADVTMIIRDKVRWRVYDCHECFPFFSKKQQQIKVAPFSSLALSFAH
jgi:thioredoxin reductase